MPTTLRVKVFPGAQNLPLYAGLDRGLFVGRGLKVQLQFTSNSTELRDGLAAGAFVMRACFVRTGRRAAVSVAAGFKKTNTENFLPPCRGGVKHEPVAARAVLVAAY